MKNGVGKNAVSGKTAALFVVVFGMCLDAGAFSVCAVGDSITQGEPGFTAHRVALESRFDALGWTVEWKGTRSNAAWGSTKPCEGYSGKNAEYVASQYESHAAAVVADVLLLHASGNYNADRATISPAYMPEAEIVSAATNAHARIIAAARAKNPKVIVLYAQVITSGKLPKYSYIPSLNSGIAALAAELNTDVSPVVVVNMADGWDWTTDCVSDKVHPSAAGASKMAAKWVAALQPLVRSGRLSVAGVRREAVSEMERTQFRGLHAGVVRPVEHVKGFLWIEAENFASYGDWEIDSQFTHKMGSSYLICPGLDTPRANAARTTVAIPRAGTWHVWVRTKDWVPEHSPGKFALELAGRRSKVLGASGLAGWRWEKALDCECAAGDAELALVDLSGAFARCDAVLLTEDASYVPPDDDAELLETRLRMSGRSEGVAEAGTFDFVVVGAGPGGMGASVAAARGGAKVALVYDRPVPGGNCSREMGIGLDGASMSRKGSREAGLAEEFRMRAARRGGVLGYAYEEVLAELADSIKAFPNERVMRVEKEGNRIVAVLSRNTLTGRWSRYRAKLFADSTGDGWVAQFAGARTMYGREDRKAFGESWTVETPDKLTMSGTIMGGCLGMRVRTLPPGEERPPYHAPAWAKVLPRPFWRPQNRPGCAWWMENPGRIDDIEDPEGARDNLIRISFDYWDWQCNEWEGKDKTRNVVLDYVPFHNARREGMRVVGDYILTGNDCVSEKVFPDAVATGGWSCDVHDPLGMENPKSDGWNLVHKGGPGPYTVPYRMLYSADIDNLFLASRCFSMSHVALGSMRVGGTVLTASQAVGTAAALCVKRGMMPREYGREHLDELRHRLFRDDMNIQWLKDDDPANLALRAKASDPGLNDGVGVPEWKSRNETADYHGWKSSDKAATLEWEKPVRAGEIRIAFDTGLKTARPALPMPRELVRDYTVEVRVGGEWRTVAKVSENMLRHRIHEFPSENIDAVRVTVERTWGDPLSRILEVRVY